MKGALDFAALLQRFAPKAQIVRSWPLTGGVSAIVTALEIAEQGQTRKLVARQYGGRDLSRNPHCAADEFRLLKFLHAAGLPVPEPLHHESGVLVTAFIEGGNGVDTPPDPSQLARFLARLHALDASGLHILPLTQVGPSQGRPDDSLSETQIRAALQGLEPEPQHPVLLHGDFWPGNTLWQAGQLAAVIDWEDAALGPPLYDVAIARLELLFFYGQGSMQDFTDEYTRLTGADFSALPYWDLRAALRPCGCLSDWGLAPYKGGQFAKTSASHAGAMVKGGLALLFAAHEVNVAQKVAHNSKDPLLQKLDSQLAGLQSSFTNIGGKLKNGQVSDADISGLDSSANAIGQTSAAGGQPIKDIATPIPGM